MEAEDEERQQLIAEVLAAGDWLCDLFVRAAPILQRDADGGANGVAVNGTSCVVDVPAVDEATRSCRPELGAKQHRVIAKASPSASPPPLPGSSSSSEPRAPAVAAGVTIKTEAAAEVAAEALTEAEAKPAQESMEALRRVFQLGLRLEDYEVPALCVPVKEDVRTYDFEPLASAVPNFDVIMMDPPWQLANSNPTRGVALGYNQVSDDTLRKLPIRRLQCRGFCLIWVINAKFVQALGFLKEWGYRYVGDIAWVKQTINRRFAKNHGYYLQHAKETCLVGFKGDVRTLASCDGMTDVLISQRRGQSQKPEDIYDVAESLVPDGLYLEIFARKNNLRAGWVSLGNEVTGAGL